MNVNHLWPANASRLGGPFTELSEVELEQTIRFFRRNDANEPMNAFLCKFSINYDQNLSC